jgi:hypothetical protein
MFLSANAAAELVNFVPTESFDIYWMSFDVLKSSFYAIALLHSMCREQSRPHASFYAAFNLCCYGASLVGDLLLGSFELSFVFSVSAYSLYLWCSEQEPRCTVHSLDGLVGVGCILAARCVLHAAG